VTDIDEVFCAAPEGSPAAVEVPVITSSLIFDLYHLRRSVEVLHGLLALSLLCL